MKKKRSSYGNEKRKRPIFLRKWFLMMLAFGVFCCALGYIVIMAMLQPYKDRAYTYDLSKIDDVEVPSLILDREGREIGRLFVENRSKVSIEEVPEKMIDALVAGEDGRFFTHDGVDYIGIMRAVKLNLQAGTVNQGASTVTQQLARNAFHLKEEAEKRGENGIERKLVEAFLAQRIEREFSKHQILEMYLNRIPFGSGFYGVRSASLGYFGKEPRDLETQECASMVGCIKNPSAFTPLRHPQNNKKARDHVLNRMRIEKTITQSEYDELIELPVEVNPQPIRRGTSHMYGRVADFVREQLGEEELTRGGYKIFTTIDRDVQLALENAMADQLKKVEQRAGYDHPKHADFKPSPEVKTNYLQGAGLMIENHTGKVIAYVGGRDYAHSQYDFIEEGRKPLGTTFLPVIYLAALEAGKTATSQLLDVPMDNRTVMVDGREGILGEWGMEVMRPRYEQEITLRRGLEASKIAASVRLGNEVGIEKVIDWANKLGFDFSKSKKLNRLFLGSELASLSEVVRAFTAFPNQGVVPGRFVLVEKILDDEGKVRYRKEPAGQGQQSQRVASQDSSFVVHDILRGSMTQGSSSGVLEQLNDKEFSGGGKTGATYDFADNWYVGYNSQVTCAVWSGFLSGSREAIYDGAFSRDTVMPIWAAAMNAATGLKAHEIPVPESISKVEVCSVSGLKKTRYCHEYKRDVVTGAESYVSTAYQEFYQNGLAPSGYCDVHGGAEGELADVTASLDEGGTNFNVIPIRPKEHFLIGSDPYNSEQPAFTVQTASYERRESSDALNFDRLDGIDAQATIKLSLPGRAQVIEH